MAKKKPTKPLLSTRSRQGPEWHIRKAVIDYLEPRGWLVEITHGNKYQAGFPDLYCHHPRYGPRWIECKNPARYAFTRAQRRKFPKWEEKGVGIWVLVDGTQAEYDKLFSLPNWRDYWRPCDELQDIDALLDAMTD